MTLQPLDAQKVPTPRDSTVETARPKQVVIPNSYAIPHFHSWQCLFIHLRAEGGDDGSRKRSAVVGSFFLSRFNGNCAAAARLAEMTLELADSVEGEAGAKAAARCITVFDEPVSRSRVERGGYLLSRRVRRACCDNELHHNHHD